MGKVSLFFLNMGELFCPEEKILQGRCLPVQLSQGKFDGFIENFVLSALANTSNYLRICLLRKLEPKKKRR